MKKIVISGLGVMGGSLALALKKNLPDAVIYGYDLPEVCEEALAKQIIDKPIVNWPADCSDAQVVFLATPLSIINQHLADLNGVVGKETIVTDIGSTKEAVSKLVKEIGFSGTYIGGHPMTGAEKSGLSAANPLLYENAVYILTGVEPAVEDHVKKVLVPVLKTLKARVMLLSPEIHDKILASISHLPQLVAVGLVNLVGSQNSDELPYFDLAAGGFRDLTRIASSSIDIWQDIISSNRENIRQALIGLINLLQENVSNLDDLKSEFSRANELRSQVPKVNKGFLSPLTDVLVYVNDEVGVVAKISNALSGKEIDIRDIELLKIREKEGGVFRLSFDNDQKAAQAVNVLNSINYQAFIRE